MLNELKEAVKKRAEEWGTTITDGSYRGNELAGEAGEVCNEIKKLERTRLGLVGGKTDTSDLEDELGDLLVCATLVAVHYDLDLEKCAISKFNKTSKKHGFKTKIEV